MITLGICLAVSFIVLGFKLGIGRVLRFQALADIVVTILFCWMLSGSYAGLAAGIIGGLVFSLLLAVISKFYLPESPVIFMPTGGTRWYHKRITWVVPTNTKSRRSTYTC